LVIRSLYVVSCERISFEADDKLPSKPLWIWNRGRTSVLGNFRMKKSQHLQFKDENNPAEIEADDEQEYEDYGDNNDDEDVFDSDEGTCHYGSD
jgi:hypothetical protein